jgi:hypothetical protein
VRLTVSQIKAAFDDGWTRFLILLLLPERRAFGTWIGSSA